MHEDEMLNMLNMFDVLGQERRYQIMLALTEKAMSNGELSALFTVPGVWPHLNKLEEAGLITRHVISQRDVKYRANPDALEAMANALSEMAVTAAGASA
jgi:predicted transcriptional regulator